MQTGKLARKHTILIYGREYWDKVLNWRHMVRTGTISEGEYKVLQFADNVDEAFDLVREQMETHYLTLDPDPQ
jgi:predicted Rossmann-fold nucleotide-binding protein